jgi:hypothetical protein
MFKRAITHRDEFITAQALIYALDGLQQLPEDQRPESNIDHRKAISRNFRSRFARWRSEFRFRPWAFILAASSWRPPPNSPIAQAASCI